jgi:putative membrane protein
MVRGTALCGVAGLVGLIASHAFALPSSADSTFAEKAAAAGTAEIQAAQLAQQRATSPQAKSFANKMVADHTEANDELQQIAQQENIDLTAAQPSPQDSADLQRLSGLNGPAFDRAYAQAQLSDHQQAVALFRQEADSGHDPALKAFAQKTLPILRQHLQMAQSLAASGR